jgi:DNA-binding GntR family transcriptional regulator
MKEHRAVLNAIAAKDAAGARAAMQRHLNQAYKRFSTGWDSVAGHK